ncbi:hypothetical protein Celaphus_00016789, partial [Cervus elaphus hippelaphus]
MKHEDGAEWMAFPPGALHPLPKRQALEKSSGSSSVFSPSVLHYQQALGSAQLQPHAAFIPTVPMMHSATSATVSAATTPATSVPFAATATANQFCHCCLPAHTSTCMSGEVVSLAVWVDGEERSFQSPDTELARVSLHFLDVTPPRQCTSEAKEILK